MVLGLNWCQCKVGYLRVIKGLHSICMNRERWLWNLRVLEREGKPFQFKCVTICDKNEFVDTHNECKNP